jgi:hypothetical protein
LLLLLAIVIHPLFDLRHAQVKRGVRSFQFALPVVGPPSVQPGFEIGHGGASSEFSTAMKFRPFSPLRC